MAVTMNEKIIITASSAAWLFALEDTATPCAKFDADAEVTSTDEKANRFLFDNIAEAGVKFPASTAATSADGEYIEVVRADGAVIRFAKETLVIEGKDETIVSDSASGTGTDSKNEITFSINEADIDSATYVGFMQKLYDLRSRKFLIVVPIGYNYKRRLASSNPATTGRNAAGFAVMVGMLTSGVDHKATANTPVKTALTFQSTTLSATEAEANAAFADGGFNGFTFDPIAQKGVREIIGANPESTVLISPPALGATDGTKLIKGDIVWLA